MIATNYVVGLSAALFCVGLFGLLTRRNAVAVFMGIELMLNAANLNFVAFSRVHSPALEGQVVAVFVIMLAAAEFALAVDRAMQQTPGLVATVGKVENSPNVGNVIPGKTMGSYDIRHQDDAVKEAAVEGLRRHADEIV